MCVCVWVCVCGCGCGCFWGVGATLLDMCNLSSPSRDQTSNPCPLPWKHGVLTTGPWGSPSLSYKCNMFVIKRKIVVKKTNIKCGDRVKPASPLSTLFRLYFQAYHFHSPTLGNILLGEWSSWTSSYENKTIQTLFQDMLFKWQLTQNLFFK